MNRSDVSSSQVAINDALAHLALPVGPNCYYAPRSALFSLITRVQELQGVMNNDVALCLKNLQYWRSAHTFPLIQKIISRESI